MKKQIDLNEEENQKVVVLKNQFEKQYEKIKSKVSKIENVENLNKEKERVEGLLKKEETRSNKLFM
jgi:hypothetical protein